MEVETRENINNHTTTFLVTATQADIIRMTDKMIPYVIEKTAQAMSDYIIANHAEEILERADPEVIAEVLVKKVGEHLTELMQKRKEANK